MEEFAHKSLAPNMGMKLRQALDPIIMENRQLVTNEPVEFEK